MTKISFFILLTVFCAATVFGQETATQQQIDKLTGQLQDLLEAQAQQGKRLEAMEKEIGELRDKVNTPQVNNSASADDLKALAEKVQEIDKKRQSDKELIIKQIENLGGKVTGGSSSHIKPAPNVTTTSGEGTATTPAGPQKGYYYVVQTGDSWAAIAKAYRESDKHVKITTSQLIKANPSVKPDLLIAGKKIFIPDPNAP